MTKATMIEIIQRRDAALWMDLVSYDYLEAPEDGDDSARIQFERNDKGYAERLSAWCAVRNLMRDLGIEPDLDLPDQLGAFDLIADKVRRRNANRAAC